MLKLVSIYLIILIVSSISLSNENTVSIYECDLLNYISNVDWNEWINCENVTFSTQYRKWFIILVSECLKNIKSLVICSIDFKFYLIITLLENVSRKVDSLFEVTDKFYFRCVQVSTINVNYYSSNVFFSSEPYKVPTCNEPEK